MSTEVPLPKSVSELRQWLKEFGKEKRQHFEQNKPSSKPFNVSRKIQKFETGAGRSNDSSNYSQNIHRPYAAHRRGAMSSLSSMTTIPFIHRDKSIENENFENDGQCTNKVTAGNYTEAGNMSIPEEPEIDLNHNSSESSDRFSLEKDAASFSPVGKPSSRHSMESGFPKTTATVISSSLSTRQSLESDGSSNVCRPISSDEIFRENDLTDKSRMEDSLATPLGLLPSLPHCYEEMPKSFANEDEKAIEDLSIDQKDGPEAPIDQLEGQFQTFSIEQKHSSSSYSNLLQAPPKPIRRHWEGIPWGRNARDDDDNFTIEAQDAWEGLNEQDTFDDGVSVATGRQSDPGQYRYYSPYASRQGKKTQPSRIIRQGIIMPCYELEENNSKGGDGNQTLTLHDLARSSSNCGNSTMAKGSTTIPQCHSFDSVTKPPSMHNATFISENIVTSGNLELFCLGSSEANRATMIPRTRSYNSGKIPPRDEIAIASTWSEDSGLPAVSPNALDSCLNSVFGAEVNRLNRELTSMTGAKPRNNLRYALYPKESYMPEEGSPNPSLLSASTESSLEFSQPKGRVKEVANQFGGSRVIGIQPRPPVSSQVTRLSAVERRKLELERKWAAERKPTHVKKVKWQAGSTGTYKKKVVLDITV